MQSRICAAIALATLASVAFAAPVPQCPQWSGQFGSPSIQIQELAVVAGQAGDEIYVRGEIPASQGTPTTTIALWDGLQWAPIPSPDAALVHSIVAFDDGTGSALYVASGTNVRRRTGSSWSTVGGSFPGDAGALEVVEENGSESLYCIGGPFPNGQVSRWNGTTWDSLGGQIPILGTRPVQGLTSFTTQSGTHLYGAVFGGLSFSLIRWNGSVWESVPSPAGGFDALAVFDDGAGPALFAAGQFSSVYGGTSFRGIARWDGTNWASLGGLQATQGSTAGRSLRVHDDGSGPALYVAGAFDVVNGVPWSSPGVARRRAGAWTTVGRGFTRESLPLDVRHLAVLDVGAGPRLAAVGRFDSCDGWYRPSGPMTWDGAAWSPIERRDDVGGDVSALAELDLAPFGRSLWVGTSYLGVGGVQNGTGVARWDGASWHAVGQGFDGSVHAFAIYPVGGVPQVHVAGYFPRSGSTALNALHSIARWDGGQWVEVGGGILAGPPTPGTVNALVVHDDGSGAGSCLFVAGDLWRAGSTYCSIVARWNGTSWTNLGGVSSDVGTALAVFDDGAGPELYAAGSFTSLPGAAAIGVARWNGASWSALGSGLNGSANALFVHDDGSGPALYVGGSFTTAGGLASPRIARWRNGAWSAVGGGIGTPTSGGNVVALAAHAAPGEPRPVLVAAGGFALPISNVVQWNGMSWSATSASSPNSTVLAVRDFGDGSATAPALYIGGRFDTVGATPSPNFAKLFDPCDAETGVAFCLGDGIATTCPCGNVGLPLVAEGCTNATGAGGGLVAVGRPWLSDDTVVLRATGLQNRPLLFFQGTAKIAGGAGTAFGDGLRCAGGTVRRIAVRTSSNGDSVYPEGAEASVSAAGLVTTPGPRYYQAWYRDPAPGYCTPSTFNTTNGLEIAWVAGGP